MKKQVIIALALLVSAPAYASNVRIKFKNCSPKKQRWLYDATESAIDRMDRVQEQYEDRLDNEQFYGHEAKQLRVAGRRIQCVLRKLPQINYVCANKYNDGALARTIPIIGLGVKIFEGAWYTERWGYPLAAVLVHEASHKCSTNDREYYKQKRINPNRDAKKHWANTASMYDWWSIHGFCIPGRDC